MANVELGRFCDLNEYNEGRKERLFDPAQLCVNAAYTMMIRLASSNRNYQTAKKAVMLDSLDVKKEAIASVKLTLLDDDCKNEVSSEASFSSGGYLSGFQDVVIFDRADSCQRFPIDQAYLQPYPEDMSGYLHEIYQSQPVLVLGRA